MIIKALKLVARAAWVGWLGVGVVALVATYGPWEARALPAQCPHMQRVVLPGAQDSSAAGVSLVRFKQVSGFGHTWTLTGSSQLAPIPAFLAIFLALAFLDINLGGPRVGPRRESL